MLVLAGKSGVLSVDHTHLYPFWVEPRRNGGHWHVSRGPTQGFHISKKATLEFQINVFGDRNPSTTYPSSHNHRPTSGGTEEQNYASKAGGNNHHCKTTHSWPLVNHEKIQLQESDRGLSQCSLRGIHHSPGNFWVVKRAHDQISRPILSDVFLVLSDRCSTWGLSKWTRKL